MKKYLLLLLAVTGFAQTNPTAFNRIRITQNIKDNLANRIVVQDSTTGELKWVLKSSLTANVPQANASTSGTVRTTTAEVNPQVYTIGIVDNKLDAKLNANQKGAINGVATLNSIGKIPNEQIPAVAISETFPISSEAQMIGLSQAEQGDIAIRSDVSKAFILRQSPSSVLGNWSELLTPASTVTSVAGKVGAVILNSNDVGLANVNNTNDANKPISAATQTGLDAKANTSSLGTNAFNSTSFLPLTGGNLTGQLNLLSVLVNGFGKNKGLRLAAYGNIQGSGQQGLFIGNNVSPETVGNTFSRVIDNAVTASFISLQNINGSSISFGTGITGDTSTPQSIDSGTRMRLFGTGNLAINKLTDNGVDKLQVNGTISALPAALSTQVPTLGQVQTALDAKISGTGTTNQLAKFTASGAIGDSVVTELANGKVGINQANPTESLDVSGNGKFSGSLSTNNVLFWGGTGKGVLSFGNNLVTLEASSENTSIAILPTGTGNVGIGKNNPTEKLDVVGNGKFSGTVSASPATASNQLVTKAQLDANSGRPYKIYVATLTQSGTNAPVANVLENTLGGTLVWSRIGTGFYRSTLSGVFTTNKTLAFGTQGGLGNTGYSNGAFVSITTPTTSNVDIKFFANGVGASDGLESSIEIRVYN